MTFVMGLAGAALMFIAWWGSSGTAHLDRQVTWTVIGVIAVILVGVGAFSWLVAGRRAVALRRAGILELLERLLASPWAGSVRASGDHSLFVVSGSERYHRGGCLLIRGKQSDELPEHASLEDLRPCEMCAP